MSAWAHPRTSRRWDLRSVISKPLKRKRLNSKQFLFTKTSDQHITKLCTRGLMKLVGHCWSLGWSVIGLNALTSPAAPTISVLTHHEVFLGYSSSSANNFLHALLQGRSASSGAKDAWGHSTFNRHSYDQVRMSCKLLVASRTRSIDICQYKS